MNNTQCGLQFRLIHTSLIAMLIGFGSEVGAQHAASSASKDLSLAHAESCHGKIPGDLSDLLAEIKNINSMIYEKQITPAQAESLFKKRLDESTKGDPEAERLVLLLANEKLAREQEGSRLLILDRLARGEKISELEQKSLDQLIPPTELPKIIEAAKPHFEALRKAGIKITPNGLDLNGIKPKTLRTDEKLQAALDMVYPGVSQSLKDGKMTIIGDTYVLGDPSNRVRTRAEYTSEVESRLNFLHREMMIYAQASIEAASYWDMMRGGLRDRAWWGPNADDPTAAQIERDGSHQSVMTLLKSLRDRYGMSTEDQKPYFIALNQISNKEREALQKTMKQLETAKWTYITAPFMVTGVGLLGRGAQMGFLFGMGVTAADLSISSAIDRVHSGGDYFCHLAKNSSEILPTGMLMSALFAPLAALRPAHLYRASSATARVANAASRKLPKVAELSLKGLTPRSAEVAYKRGLLALGIPGLIYTGKAAHGAYEAHQTGKVAEKSGNAALAEQAFLERDKAIAHSTLGAALSALPWFAGRSNLKHSSSRSVAVQAATKTDVINRFTTLRSQKLKKNFANDTDGFLKNFDEFVGLRDQTRGTDSKEFLAWWKNNHSRYTSDSYKKALGRKDHSFDDMLEIAGHDFFMEVGKLQAAGWRQKFSHFFSPKVLLAGGSALVVGVTSEAVKSVRNAVTLAPMMRLVNAYTDAPIVPLEAYLRQRGNKDFGGVATDIQNWLTNGIATKGHLAEMEANLNEFRKASRSASGNPEQEKIWKDFQSYFYKKFLIFNQSLPGNIREGRASMMGFDLMDTASLVNIMATRYESYLGHKRDFEDMQIRIEKGETLTPVEEQRMSDFKADMDRNLDAVASVLAIYKIRQFMYRDDLLSTANPIKTESEVQLEGTFDKVAQSMGYKYFNEKVADRLEIIFGSYKGVFAIQDQKALSELQAADANKK